MAVFVLALSTGTGSAGPAHAQEIQITGPLVGAPAAVPQRSYPSMHFDLGPTVSFPIAAEAHATPLAGARLGYWGSGRWMVGAWGAHAVETVPRGHGSDRHHGQLSWIAAPEVGLVPLAGRLSCLDIPALLALSLGPALVGLDERADCDGGCAQTALFSHVRRTAFAATGAVALTLQPVRVVALTIDWRMLTLERSRGVDLAGSGADGESPDGRIDARDRELSLDHLMTLRLSVMIPDEIMQL